MTNEEERLDQELAELRVKYPDVSIMGKHGIKELTLITEGKNTNLTRKNLNQQGRANDEKG